MCGITGLLSLDGARICENERLLLQKMTDTLAHRGPNDSDVWVAGGAGLGHRRLSVIDLSTAGRQPMTNEDGSIVIAFNGEIYNFMELEEKFQLRARGHQFRSRTDTEVLVHLYEELGMDMVKELNGMFAFAIWDGNTGKMHLARDQYGIKPLFYQKDGSYFRFGSEIKAILADPRVARRASMQALHDFMTFNYIPGTQTAFEGIHELAPGHQLTVTANGKVEIARYWDLDFTVDHSIGEREAIEGARARMEEAVRRQIVADVPVGVFLSGGLDSSTLVALMAKQTDERIHTYSIGFEDDSFNELPFARTMAEAFNTRHKEVMITADRVRELLPKYITYIDEPYGDGSAIPTYCISELAKDDVVVVLSGEGGDEVFAGYDTYKAYQMSQWFGMVPGFIRNGIIKPLAQSLPVSDKKLSFEFKLKRFLGGQDLPPEEAHLWWRVVLSEAEKMALYTEDTKENLLMDASVRHFTAAYDRSDAPDILSRLMYIDSTVFLPDDLMIKNDRMTMAHSLEARVPFTDPDLASFLASVPPHLKMKGGRKKHLMREAMRDLLPKSILDKKKVGLEMPYSRWLKAELNDLMMDHLGPKSIERMGIFRPEAISALIGEHMAGKRDNGRALWGLLNYAMWHDHYIQKASDPVLAPPAMEVA